MEMYEIITGDLHVWWREMKSLTVVMYERWRCTGWRYTEKVELDVEGFYTGRWKNNLGGGDNRETIIKYAALPYC